MNEKIIDLYLNLAFERHSMWYKRTILKEPKPWTNNKILRDFHFTNVFRDLDKTSQYIINKVIKPLSDDFENLWRHLIVYRYISKLEIFEEIEPYIIPGDFRSLEKHLKYRELEGKSCVTGAYFIRHTEGMRLMEYVFNLVEQIDKSDFRSVLKENSLQKMTKFYTQFECVGGFMAYEYTTDLTYTSALSRAEDLYTWANLGPGCNTGINLLKKRYPLNKKNQDYLEDMEIIKQRWEEKFRSHSYSKLPKELMKRLIAPQMRDIEHWLCEFGKYAKYHTLVSKNIAFKHRKYQGRC
ncbi:MAG: hypothetical protein GWN64_07805 [Candidatus Thorarchaeota archaeon]|nr:hypothetical protein [Candidatus Thorarchaeota archaeon]